MQRSGELIAEILDDDLQISDVTTQVDRLKAFRGQSCVTTHNFGYLSWLMVIGQVDRLKVFRLKVGVPNTSAFSLNT